MTHYITIYHYTITLYYDIPYVFIITEQLNQTTNLVVSL